MRLHAKAFTLGAVTIFIALMIAQTVTPQSPISEDRKRKLGSFDPADIFPSAREGVKDKDKKKDPLTTAPPMTVKRAASSTIRGDVLGRTNPRKSKLSPSSGESPLVQAPDVTQKTDSITATEAPRDSAASANQLTNAGTQPIAGPSGQSPSTSAATNDPNPSNTISKSDGSQHQDKTLTLIVIFTLFVIVLATLIAMIVKLMRFRARVS